MPSATMPSALRRAAPPSDSSPPFGWRLRLRGLYVITDGRFGDGGAAESGAGDRHIAMARAALSGGARIIQLRDKSMTTARLLPVARELRCLTRRSGALLIVNDRVDIALACDADGVHLGPDDLPVADARRLLGPHCIIGVSCGDVEAAHRAEQCGADYIGAGAVFTTATKDDAGAPIGIDNLRAIVNVTTLPVAAIGGIDERSIARVVEAGACMACVVSAVATAGDEAAMTAAARALLAAAHFQQDESQGAMKPEEGR